MLKAVFFIFILSLVCYFIDGRKRPSAMHDPDGYQAAVHRGKQYTGGMLVGILLMLLSGC